MIKEIRFCVLVPQCCSYCTSNNNCNNYNKIMVKEKKALTASIIIILIVTLGISSWQRIVGTAGSVLLQGTTLLNNGSSNINPS